MEDALKKVITEVMSDREIVAFCEKNQISEKEILSNISFFYQQKQANDTCQACLGKKPCVMDVFEMQSQLEYHHGNINLRYHRCTYLNSFDKDYLDILFLPDVIPSGKLFKDKEERNQINNKISQIIHAVSPQKGIYLHGAFGTGKTYIMLKMAEAFAKTKQKVVFAYYPDLVRHIKSSIGNEGYEELVFKLKTAPILILDDIGGEMNSSFIRDEILGSILQYRMMGKLLTFMTSNLNLDQLRNHLLETKYEEDELRSDRILERITYLMEPIYLQGKNYR